MCYNCDSDPTRRVIMDLSETKAVDVHSHFSVHGSGIETPSRNRSLDHLLKMNAAANIAVSFVTTYEVAENGQDCDIANEETLKVARERDDLFAWITVDPRKRIDFCALEKTLNDPRAIGLKILPISHSYDPRDYKKEIFGFASEIGTVVQMQLECEALFATDIADEYPNAKIILGANRRKGYAEALRDSKKGNLYIDIAGGAQVDDLILERLVNMCGDDHILFGTDGITAPAFIRGRVEYAFIPETSKIRILRDNAIVLFGEKIGGVAK